MILYIFAIVIGVFILGDFVYNRQRITPFCAIATPYLFIVLINNLYAVDFGFYSIDEDTILMIGLSLVLFFAGQFVVYLLHPMKNLLNKAQNADYLPGYNIGKLYKFCFVANVVAILWAGYWVVFYGVTYLNDNEGLILTGPVAHLILAMVVVLPILFCKWLADKTQYRYLFVTLPVMPILFLSFVKYNIIWYVIYLFLVVVAVNGKYLYKSLVLMLGGVAGCFSLNYFLAGLSNGNVIPTEFYINHIWKYIAGGCINDGYMFTSGVPNGDIIQKIVNSFMSLPNMVIGKFLDYKFIYELPSFGFWNVAEGIGETSNVRDFFGCLYPFVGNWVEQIIYGIFIVVLGMIAGWLYCEFLKNDDKIFVSVFVFMTFAGVLCFFANYWALNCPWELMMWAWLMPKLFEKSVVKEESCFEKGSNSNVELERGG